MSLLIVPTEASCMLAYVSSGACGMRQGLYNVLLHICVHVCHLCRRAAVRSHDSFPYMHEWIESQERGESYLARTHFHSRSLQVKYPAGFRPGMYEATYRTYGKLLNTVDEPRVTSLPGKLMALGERVMTHAFVCVCVYGDMRTVSLLIDADLPGGRLYVPTYPPCACAHTLLHKLLAHRHTYVRRHASYSVARAGWGLVVLVTISTYTAGGWVGWAGRVGGGDVRKMFHT